MRARAEVPGSRSRRKALPVPSVLPLIVAVGAVLALAAPQLSGQATPSAEEVARQFVGNYELVSYESFTADGDTVDNGYVGRILYDEHGNMSAVGMPRDLPEDEDGWSGRRGFAYFGTFEVHPEEGYVVHRVRGSPVDPDWVGRELVRYYELEGDLLRLSLRNDEGRTLGTLTWRRY